MEADEQHRPIVERERREPNDAHAPVIDQGQDPKENAIPEVGHGR
jgi:hypothetical protein